MNSGLISFHARLYINAIILNGHIIMSKKNLKIAVKNTTVKQN